MKEQIRFLPDDKLAPIKVGENILKTAVKSRVYIKHVCGGKGACLTCKVYIDNQSKVSKPSLIELRKLGEDMIQMGTRLACQTKALMGVTIEVPEDPLKKAIRDKLKNNEM